MTQPRHRIVSLDHTAYYHCVSRCVRRAYLCGQDQATGKDFSHRRDWIESRLKKLSTSFAIDILAYAVMSNHYHVVLHINPAKAESWTDDEVESKWAALYNLPTSYLVARDSGSGPTSVQICDQYIALWRARLSNLGWFMRAVNEPLARIANQEDDCTGRFWEGRYRSQALLDEAAVLKCMAYVDLNPIRAGVARTPESSNFTSIRARLNGDTPHLADFAGDTKSGLIPANYQQYLQLIDWTGRTLRDDRSGRMSPAVPSIFERLDSRPSGWIRDIKRKIPFRRMALGSPLAQVGYRQHLRQQWIVGATL